jgi:conjugative transfer region protein TrbK
MSMKTLERLPSIAAMMLVVLVVAACAIRLRGDEDRPNSSARIDGAADPLATKLAECRFVTYEQKAALSECQNVWAEKRRQFLGQKPSASSGEGNPQEGSSLFVPPKDESRLSPGYPQIRQPGKE